MDQLLKDIKYQVTLLRQSNTADSTFGYTRGMIDAFKLTAEWLEEEMDRDIEKTIGE